jgi:ribosomal protein S18 acetylase RimI-like enzyme
MIGGARRAVAVRGRSVGAADREAALARLRDAPRENLLLLDLVAGAGGEPAPGEAATEVVGLWRRRDLLAVGAIRPCVVPSAGIEPEALEAFLPFLDVLGSGLVKAPEEAGGPLWQRLSARGRLALVDRVETAYALERARVPQGPADPELFLRDATPADLPALVESARASLREEGRPDPFEGDPDGFRRWVRGRVARACVAERAGRIAFVGSADVRRPEGWLLQGVYTWPEARRRGVARRGVAELCRRAFAAGADHVQLSVVEGNRPAESLYEGLGFEPYARLRTILFAS